MNKDELDKFVEEQKLKKVSFNIFENSLNMIDDLAKVCGINRTMAINMLLGDGFRKTVEDLEKRWTEMKKDKKNNPEKINKKLNQLKELIDKYDLTK